MEQSDASAHALAASTLSSFFRDVAVAAVSSRRGPRCRTRRAAHIRRSPALQLGTGAAFSAAAGVDSVSPAERHRHTGFSTAAEKVAAYLERYPALWCELSYRYGITAGGKLTPEWKRLFERYPDRFLLGSDTWINERWDSYGSIMADYRTWLAQLPQGVAEKIAFRNAEHLFKR
jgi:hypothetical protein